LIPQKIGEICCQSVPHSFIFLFCYEAATELQAQQLANVEHLPVMTVAPAVKSVCFISTGDFVIWYEGRLQSIPSRFSAIHLSQIERIRYFKKAPLMKRFAAGTVIFHSEHPVFGRPNLGVRIAIDHPAVRARAAISSCWSDGGEWLSTIQAFAGLLPVLHFV
jgi:hypothetical protein